MDQLSVEAKIQIESKIQDIVAELLVWWLHFLMLYVIVRRKSQHTHT